MAVWLAEKTVRLRRAGRRDLAVGQALVPARVAAGRRVRFDRRLMADLGSDVYVAETSASRVVGVLAVSYVRSLAAGRFVALLDTLCAEPDHAALLGPMLAFAEARARRRGCRELIARPGLEVAAGAALEANGWARRATLTRVLPDVPGDAD
jgi:hypothetical protein